MGAIAADTFHADHDEAGRPLGYSSEEQRSNLLHDTETFQSGWTKSSPGISLISAMEIAPDGQADGELWEFDQTAGTRQVSQASIACAGNTTYSLSIWVKGGNANAPTLLRSRVTGNVSGTIIGGAAYTKLNGDTLNPRAESGWVRGAVSFTTGAGDTTLTVTAVEVQTDGGPNSDAQLLLWGTMLEAGLFPSSYIANPGASGTVTRSADILTIPVADRFAANDAGTILVEWRSPAGLKASGQSYILMAGNVDTTEQIGINANHNNGHSFDFGWRIGGVWKSTLRPAGSAAALTDYRSAIAWARDGSRIAFNNGVSASTASADGVPAVEEFRIGYLTPSSSWSNGWIRRLRYWPYRLGDGDLARLTA
ncbi:MAG: hypothetical protein HOH66_13395 [Rhodospirillaceae bacterium]|nr:hypothetical protein [Rhodospirillaceae bacterium]MBT6118854.1 hypothetical protein [Rhodospirillaceae bacterium]